MSTFAPVATLKKPLFDPSWLGDRLVVHLDPGHERNVVISGQFQTAYNLARPSQTGFVQNTAGLRPYYLETGLGGRPAFDFRNAQYMVGSGVMPTGNYTKLAVFKLDNTTNNNNILSASASGATSHALWMNGGSTLKGYHGANFVISLRTSNTTNIEVVALTYNAATNEGKLYQNGVLTRTGTATNDNANTDIHFGAFAGGNFLDGQVGHVLICNDVLTPLDIRELTRDLLHYYQTSLAYTFVFDGDSLTAGSGVPAQDNLVSKVSTIFSGAYTTTNDGTGGHTLANMDTTATAGIDTVVYNTNQVPLLICWGGTNDMTNDGQTPTVAYNRLRTYLQNRKAAGFNRIIVITALPRTNESITNNMFAFNDLIRNNWSTLEADGASLLVDTQQLAPFNSHAGLDGGTSGTYYQADNIHIKAASYTLLAQKVAEQINQLRL